MNTASPSALSNAITGLLGEFLPHAEKGVNLDRIEVSNIIVLLASMQSIATDYERELGSHRLAEVNRFGRQLVDDLGAEQLSHLLVETEGKIIRPRFGNQKPTGKEPA